MTPHNQLRDQIAREYLNISNLWCKFCKQTCKILHNGVAQVVIEHHADGFRADVAALDADGSILTSIEVVDNHPPHDDVLAAQSELPAAFYVQLDALDAPLLALSLSELSLSGWCSAFCWMNREQENASGWSAPRCDYCGIPLHVMEFSAALHDWANDPQYAYCLLCAARMGGQWRTPGELALGDFRDRIPLDDADVGTLFMSFSDADFWSMVWSKRTHERSESRGTEGETSNRLGQVEVAFDNGDWESGYMLLHPIGAPNWDRDHDEPRLLAWNHDNCVRVARAWRRLREYRLECLPRSIQGAIRSRPPLIPVITDLGQAGQCPALPLTHRGFPDGRFTACGIDREKSAERIEATMTGKPTCEPCAYR